VTGFATLYTTELLEEHSWRAYAHGPGRLERNQMLCLCDFAHVHSKVYCLSHYLEHTRRTHMVHGAEPDLWLYPCGEQRISDYQYMSLASITFDGWTAPNATETNRIGCPYLAVVGTWEQRIEAGWRDRAIPGRGMVFEAIP
jgi:hypothetical protein